jgi:hypothetical protein
LEQTTFTFKQVEAILADVFAIAPVKRKTFAARLQQLQKMGLPHGSNTGRGSRATYATWQLCDLQFYLDLLDAGATPALIAARYKGLGFFSVDGTGRSAELFPNCYVHTRFNSLKHLSSSDLTTGPEGIGYNEWSIGPDLAKVLKFADGKPGILIDLAVRLRKLKVAIAVHRPELAEQLFPTLEEISRMPHRTQYGAR